MSSPNDADPADGRRPFVAPTIRPAEGPRALLKRRDVLKATGTLAGTMLGLQSLGLLAQSGPQLPGDPQR